MPHYFITIRTKSGKLIKGVRFSDEYNIDKAWQLFEAKAINTVKDMKTFDLMMLSKRSLLYKEWLAEEQRRKTPRSDINDFGQAFEKGNEGIRYSTNDKTKKSETAKNWGMNGNNHRA